jgi:hypothetical protein
MMFTVKWNVVIAEWSAHALLAVADILRNSALMYVAFSGRMIGELTPSVV